MSEKIKVMYIDDENLNVQLFEINFSGKYDVYTGYSGQEGLELLEKHPDIKTIISDMKMPKMNGIEFIKKAKDKYPDKRFYILTGFEITEEIQEAIETGLIHSYLRKPFNKQEIENAISGQI